LHTNIHQEQAVLIVQYDGELSFAARAETLDKVVPILRAQGLRRVLVDFTGAWPSRETTSDAEAFASKLVSAGFPEATSVAYLNPPPAHGDLGERVAPLAGFVVRRFFNRRHAIEWLHQATAEA
jgi:hypothetical protein